MDINNLLKEKLIAQNPKMKQILEIIEQQSDNQEDPSRIEKLRLYNKKLTLALKREISKNKVLTKEMETLEAEIQFIDEINEELATAIGACPECWGTIDNCGICKGLGKAANFPVDRKAFVKYVLPAIKNTSWVNQMLIDQNTNK